MGIPPDGAEPPFVLIANVLREAIRDRKDGYGAGDKLPSHRELARTFGVAVGTVQNALRQLRQDGLLVSRAGSGVFVRSDLDAMGCPLALTPPVALHHPAAVRYGETIYMIIALLSEVLTDGSRQMLLSGLAAHDIADAAQGRDESRLVPSAREVHHTVLRRPVTEISVLLGAAGPTTALAILEDHLATVDPDIEVIQVQIGGGYTTIAWPS